MANYPYKNLVFKGGGVKGTAYVGALKALEEAGIMNNVVGLAGTSAGSIIAALAACKIDSDTIYTFLKGTDYTKFKDSGGIFGFVEDLSRKFGPYKGDYFLNDWFKVFLKSQNIDPEITFEGVNQKFGTNLKVFSTDLNTQTIQTFSKDTTPTVQIAEAVRASMSIPLFFEAWQFSDGNPTNHLYVDGGVMYNYPIDTFDGGNQPDQTLGLFLTNITGPKSLSNDLDYGVSHLELYIKSLFESLMNSQDLMIQNNNFEEKRTVQIDDFGISATDFDITQAQVAELYNSGYSLVKKFLGIS